MQRSATEAQFAEYVIAYDQLWRKGGRMLSVGLHLRIIGRVGRIAWLDRVLRNMRDRGHVWLARRDGISCHLPTQFPIPRPPAPLTELAPAPIILPEVQRWARRTG